MLQLVVLLSTVLTLVLGIDFALAFSAETSVSNIKQTANNDVVGSKIKRIAIVGAGAVGSYYGGRIWEGMKNNKSDDIDTQVMFQLRNEHYDHCTQHGIDISSYHGDFSIPPDKLLAYQTTEDMAKSVNDGGIFDWVIVALKSTSLDQVPTLIEPLLSSETRLLVIMNGLIEEDLIDMLRKQQQRKGLDDVGCKAIYGGMALICSNRLSPGKISHTYGGKVRCGVAYSADANSDDNWVESDRQAILDLFKPITAVPFEFDPNLRRGRWWKNVWNLPFSGISVSMGGITVDQIVNDPSLRKLSYKIIDETIAIANADLKKHGCSDDELLSDETRDEMMTLSDNMGPYKTSIMLDYQARKPMEVKYLFRKAVDRADELGISAPYLDSIVCHAEAYQRRYDLF